MKQEKLDKLPVAILTGFLGSGKTTLLNYLVNQPNMKKTAVIINEFGEIGIDHLLVESSEEQLIEMNNGCICCTLRGDLADKLSSLGMWIDSGRIPPIERIVVETTGLADPVPIMHTLMTDENLLNRFTLHSVLTMVDAVAGLASLDRFKEATKQIAIADQLILSKTDLINKLSSQSDFQKLEHKIYDLNPRARVHEVVKGVIDPETFFMPENNKFRGGIFADLERWLRKDESILNKLSPDDSCCEDMDHDHEHEHEHEHDHDHERHTEKINSFVIEFNEPIDSDSFNKFMQDIMIEFGDKILRIKGILNVKGSPDTPGVFHSVQHVLFPVSWLREWPDTVRSSRLVFITFDLPTSQIKDRFKAQFV